MNNISYNAVITLKPNRGYTFYGISGSFIHSNSQGKVTHKFDGDNCIVTVVFPPTQWVKVDKTDLTGIIAKPVTGFVPQAAFSNEQYFLIFSWTNPEDDPHTGEFDVHTEYSVAVTFIPEPGYTFTGVNMNSFRHLDAKEIVYNEISGKILIFFNPTEKVTVTAVNLTDLIPAPIPGGTPAIEFSGPQYTGFIEWFDDEGESVTGTFILGNFYTAVATLTVFDGYKFDNFTGNFIHDIADNVSYELDGEECLVTVIFPKARDPVSSLNLSSLIPATVSGNTPLVSFVHSQYNGTIEWIDVDGIPAGSKFTRFKLYKAVITLDATENYTFAGVNLADFSHSNRVSYIPVAGSLISSEKAEIIIVFDTVVGFQYCCWNPSTTNILYLFDNNFTTHWEYPRSSAIGNSSWANPLRTSLPSGVSFDGNECGKGHEEALKLLGLTPAHFFTFDFGETKEILSYSFHPRQGDNPFGLVDVYVSDEPIGVNPAGADLVVQNYDFKVNDLTRWYTVDIAGEHGSAPSGRYVQIRVRKIYDRNNLAGGLYEGGWISPSVSEMRIVAAE